MPNSSKSSTKETKLPAKKDTKNSHDKLKSQAKEDIKKAVVSPSSKESSPSKKSTTKPPLKAKATTPGNESEDIETGDVNDKIRDLIQLSKEQGYLTVQDINDALPEKMSTPEDIENVINILENLEIDILDTEEVERYKQRLEDSEEEEVQSSQLDILDDPVRMYLKQMGQVPLLTREQEVAISKRIEMAEQKAQDELFGISLTLDFQIELARKLLKREERFDRIVSDKKIDSRELYFQEFLYFLLCL